MLETWGIIISGRNHGWWVVLSGLDMLWRSEPERPVLQHIETILRTTR